MKLCVHFGTCGGCALQDIAPDEYRTLKRDIVVDVLARHGFADAVVEEIVSVPPRTRRRATFKVQKQNGAVQIGFHAAKSHTIVDIQECQVLTPALFAAVPRLREMMAALMREGDTCELHVTDTDTGLDIAIGWNRPNSAKLIGEIARWATKFKFARITSGNDILVELATPRIQFGKASVDLPPEAFLQPTREGEAVLQKHVIAAIGKAKHIADLFSGCGTFALPLAERARVHAVELERPMLDALAKAARNTSGLKPLTTEARDLFKRPLTAPELSKFDCVVLDPPRAGAVAQAKELVQSKIARIAYVSCNAASFARDASILAEGGFRMGPVTPVDQFLWSSHIELVAAFARS